MPPAETEIIAVRAAVVVLAAHVTVTVPLFQPEAAETAAHEAELTTVQSEFEVIVKF